MTSCNVENPPYTPIHVYIVVHMLSGFNILTRKWVHAYEDDGLCTTQKGGWITAVDIRCCEMSIVPPAQADRCAHAYSDPQVLSSTYMNQKMIAVRILRHHIFIRS